MWTIAEIQTQIFEQTGIKTSVKKLTGSMKHHICFTPMFQGGKYPEFPFKWRQTFVKQFKIAGDLGNWASSTGIDILKINITESEPIKYQKERKPKLLDTDTPQKGWGSKNSQLRLDKATQRNAVRLRKGNTARYY